MAETFQIVAWTLVLAALAWLALSGGAGPAWRVPAPAPHPRYPAFDEYDAVSPLHRRRTADMLTRFAGVYQGTFTGEGCSRDAIVDMHEMRSRALASLYEIRMRLPNDAARHDTLTAQIERVERSTLAHIDDVADRCRLGRLHTKPVHDHYYAHWYRAANDTEP